MHADNKQHMISEYKEKFPVKKGEWKRSRHHVNMTLHQTLSSSSTMSRAYLPPTS